MCSKLGKRLKFGILTVSLRGNPPLINKSDKFKSIS